jgi:hypothetical protein
MSTHTPGPWKRERHVKGRMMDVISDRPFDGDEIPVRIASDIEKANADLIAAAPDLFAVCEMVLLRGHAPNCRVMTVAKPKPSDCECLVGPASAAIAKARGGQ